MPIFLALSKSCNFSERTQLCDNYCCFFLVFSDMGATRFRRRSQCSAEHTEDQFPRKSTGKQLNANDMRYALAA